MSSEIKTLPLLNLDSAGTAQRLNASTIECEVVVIAAASGNTGTMYIGDSNVSSSRFIGALAAGDAMSIEAGKVSNGTDRLDLKEIWFDGGTTGDDISVGYIQRQR